MYLFYLKEALQSSYWSSIWNIILGITSSSSRPSKEVCIKKTWKWSSLWRNPLELLPCKEYFQNPLFLKIIVRKSIKRRIPLKGFRCGKDNINILFEEDNQWGFYTKNISTSFLFEEYLQRSYMARIPPDELLFELDLQKVFDFTRISCRSVILKMHKMYVLRNKDVKIF